ncbi:MAG: aminopeptidase P family protein [Sphaerochaetaceae bacterium]|nr:aminopeptidase P family protein [Sphaerochaetaceae bacterium]MDC7237179.1 aminopeptidase P family protein [Sphaerochaetaceae bacterium]MDC7250194.1 aminopeptidase P family protein [Sphaerochaetaceae bacterium]
MEVKNKLSKLRELMKENNLDGYYINGTDPHSSEYVCPRWKTRAFISDFTGSAGTALITNNKAYLWVDSRYFIQADEQTKDNEFIIMKMDIDNTPTVKEFINSNFKEGSRIGFSKDTLMINEKKDFEKDCKNVEIVVTNDLLNNIWENRASIPETKVVEMDVSLTGFSRGQKLNMIRIYLGEKKADYAFFASLDDIAWTLNLRGNDIEHTPVFLSYLLVTKEKAYLFTSEKRFEKEILENVKKDVEVYPYESVVSKLEEILESEKTLLINEKNTNSLFEEVILSKKLNVIDELEVTTRLKACKNDTELEGMRRAHLLDGVAMVNFLASLDFEKGEYSEIQLTQILKDFRLKNKECIDLSFNTISGFKENGALCHYSVSEESSKEVKPNGLLVLDSGGCYESGTTDITRTLLFGEATEEEIRDYTLVLKGHIALALQSFPKGTKGHQLDILARQFLWNYGLTYFHGTGHGVGHRLSVHEGPQRISTVVNDYPLQKGMILSDEPGLYKEGRHGIRIENLVAVQNDVETEFGQFLNFEILTLCPYERKLIDVSLLTEKEFDYINSYHSWVYNELKDLVDEQALSYLKRATLPLEK